MFNLLPDILKNKVKVAYHSRLFITILVFFIFIQISFLIFLFPSWLASIYKEKEMIAQREEQANSPLTKDANPIASVIKNTNDRLKILNTVMRYPEVLPLFNSIIENKTPSISITTIDYFSTSQSASSISISGVSSTRESLVSFSNKLKESKLFKLVDLPVSNFTKDKNIVFSMNLIIGK